MKLHVPTALKHAGFYGGILLGIALAGGVGFGVTTYSLPLPGVGVIHLHIEKGEK